MNKKIKFIPQEKYVETYGLKPISASLAIPDWYKSAKGLMHGEKNPGLGGMRPTSATNSTYKHCSPFLDSFMSGYAYQAPVDIEFRKVPGGGIIVRWRGENNYVSDHAQEQHPNLPGPESWANGVVYKWENPFIIETPPGYSTLFTHPLNRFDLPFRTMSGVVDTDNYPLSVHFPFQLLDFDGERIIVEEGTPLVQFLPFRRDDWISETCSFDAEDVELRRHNFFKKIVRSYKKRFWVRKSYK